jgi:MFS family permease
VTTAEASRYRWAILAVCVLGFMQTHVHRVGFAPLIPTFIADMGLSYAAAGTIMAAYFWTYALMQVPVGVLTDRLGPRRVMLACMGVMAVGALAFALAHTWTQSLLARCVVGAGAAATWLPGLRLIHEWFPLRERGLATGLFSARGGGGDTTALLLLPVLAQHLGWRVGYALLALPVLITMIAVWALVGPTPRERDAAAVAGAPGGFTASMRDVLTMPVLRPFNLYVLFSYGGYFALLTWLPTFLVKSEGLGQAGAGVVNRADDRRHHRVVAAGRRAVRSLRPPQADLPREPGHERGGLPGFRLRGAGPRGGRRGGRGRAHRPPAGRADHPLS